MRISDWSSDVCSSDLYLAGHEGQGVNAIARATNLSPSTCFGILKTLVGEEFAEFDPGSKHYRLGTAPSRLFHVDTRLSDWSRWLEDQMLAPANEFETSPGLWEIASDRAVRKARRGSGQERDGPYV